MKTNIENPLSLQNDIVIQELSGEVLIYDLDADKAFCLNETSALVWNLCDGNSSVLEISRKVSRKMGEAVGEDFISLTIEQLKNENLLANGNRIKTFDSVSRREVVKKIGLASMIALPLVSSLIASASAMAASPAACGNIGDSCSVNSQCCSNFCDDCFTATCQPDPGGIGGCL